MTQSNLTAITQLIARAGISLIFIVAGYSKILAYAGTQAYMESMGVPGFLLPLVILLELAGGISLLIGWQTRIIAFFLAGFTVMSALIFHLNFADQVQSIMFMKNLAIAGGLLLMVSAHAHILSVDAKIQRA